MIPKDESKFIHRNLYGFKLITNTILYYSAPQTTLVYNFLMSCGFFWNLHCILSLTEHTELVCCLLESKKEISISSKHQ